MPMKKIVSIFAKLLFLLSCCVLSAFAISFPLWIFSSKFPKVYTFFCVLMAFSFVIYGFIKAIKKYSFFRTLRMVVFFALLVFSLYLAVHFVFIGNRIFSLVTVFLAILIETVFMKLTGNHLANKK